MKKLLVLILGMTFCFSVEAQFKSFSPIKDNEKSDYKQLSHADKINGKKASERNLQFVPQTLDFVRNSANGLKVVSRDEHNNLPLFIEGIPEKTLRSGNNAEDRSFNFLENARDLMQIENPSEEFKVIKVTTDDLGYNHVKLQQQLGGVPVYGSEVIYHYNDKESFLNGRYKVTPELESLTPSLEKEDVKSIAVNDIGGITEVADDKFGIFDFEKVKNELVIYESRLAYHLSVYKNIVDLWEYFVDAHTGEIIHKHAGMCKFHNHISNGSNCNHDHSTEAMTPPPNGPVLSNAIDLFGNLVQVNTYEINGTFYMIDAAKNMFDGVNSNLPDDPVGTVWTIDAFNTSPQNSNFQFDHVTSGAANFSGKPTGVSAQYNGGQAYLYFENVHARESINGSGGNVIGLINIADEDGSSLGNAFWNGVAMFYGNGDSSFKPLARGLDVAGHEMSHGVIQATANLEYQGESGALNESFADIFGAMIDREDWLIGEDVVNTSAFPSGALRSLSDPHNGAATGDFNRGWQPKKYSERFTGPEDNGGVHINSGIPNHAFYLFAESSNVGKNRAEKVFYRALDIYLTKSSQFIDARLAVVRAAEDLYGSSVANAAKAAFDDVEIFDGSGTNNQTDIDVNPGADLILFTTSDQNNLYIADSEGNLIFNPLTEADPISVPSITDDGSEIVFVNSEGKLYYLRLDWSTNSVVEEGVLNFSEIYRNVVFSRDGLKMAVLRGNFSTGQDVDNQIFVFDWNTLTGVNYELFNPTFTQGESTGDVLFADAMEFDFSSQYLMYDAFNRLPGTGSSDIEYWDIGFIKVFNNDSETFTLGNDIQKLFSQLPEGISIGNPTFSKNSDYIIAFDYLENNEFSILGTNSETGDVGEIFTQHDRPGYPSYSNDDNSLLFDAVNNSGSDVVAVAQLADNKIQSTSATVQLGFQDTGVKWGVWFGNGERVLANDEVELAEDAFHISPNPSSDYITVRSEFEDQIAALRITDMMGKTIYNDTYQFGQDKKIDISTIPSGQYILTIIAEEGRGSKMFVKQ